MRIRQNEGSAIGGVFFARLFVCKITQNVVGGFQRNYLGG